MPELPRNKPHIVLRDKGSAEGYTTRGRAPRHHLPQRDRAQHSALLRAAIDVALAAAQTRQGERTVGDAKGFYLDFELTPGSEHAAELLELRTKGIELVAMREGTNNGPSHATVFVPDNASGVFQKKIDDYGTKDTKPRKPGQQPKPQNQELIARLQSVAIADLRSIFTDEIGGFPKPGERICWELWVRPHGWESLVATAEKLEIQLQTQRRLAFPDREVCLAYADDLAMARLFVNSDAIAELRRAKDTPSIFLSWINREQAEWARDVANRLVMTLVGAAPRTIAARVDAQGNRQLR